jgi:hypothetical protein
MPSLHSRGWDELWPTDELARTVVSHLRGGEDFPHGTIDWLAVAHLSGGLVGGEDPQDTIVDGAGPPARARAAVRARRAILSGDRPVKWDQPVSFETLGAVYFRLTAGGYTRECPNHHAPQGRHRWRFGDNAPEGGRALVCDFCGDERLSGR